MFSVKPVLECVKAATVVPPSGDAFPVGDADVPQTVPRADNAAPPSEEIVAPRIAEVGAIDETVGEDRVGEVADAVPTNLISSILNCDVALVCLNLILKLAVAGMVPVGVINIQVAVPVPVALE